ncbi:serine hydrolase [Reichenbachiella sp.]|uniref:serine hydrolase n=1 Tax=Reichenbachiella sp. TaxID=2184521 RepID=UPI003298937B
MKPYLICIIALLITFSGCDEDSEKVVIPEITSISPIFGHEGEEIAIKGLNFSSIAVENIVRFGSKQATVLEASMNQLKVLVPEDAIDGNITVRVGNSSTTSNEVFTVLVNLQKEVEQAMASSGIPSLAMAVLANDKVHYSQGFGQYDVDLTKAADESTLYITSSIGKLVVSIAVMQQVELGEVDIDRDISDYVGFEVRNPNFPDKEITVKMVMEHGSSLSNPGVGEIIDDVFAAIKPDSAIALHPIIEEAITPGSSIYKEGIWMNVEPGTFHKNSNYGITLLGYMVEKLSGQHFNDYSKEKILTPLGMSSSSFHYPDIDHSKAAVIYGSDGSILEPFSFFFYPAGMLRTSTSDWSQLLFMMLNGGTYNGNKILETSSVEALLDVKYPQGNSIAYDSSIGLVWRQAAGSTGWIGHTGAGVGVTHVTEINREKNVAYVIFTNRVGNGGVIGPGGSLYTEVHKWLDQIDLVELNAN